MIGPRMTAVTTLSPVYPLGTRVNERGRLEIGGCDAVELAREFGMPAYVVAADDLRARARSFVDALAARHADFDVLFASKGFPSTAVYRLLADEGLACDVASGGELFLALRGGFDPARIYFHGNAKSVAELREAVAAGGGEHGVASLGEVDGLQVRGGGRVAGGGGGGRRAHGGRLPRRARAARVRGGFVRPAAGGSDPDNAGG